jgi:hypothetical protein
MCVYIFSHNLVAYAHVSKLCIHVKINLTVYAVYDNFDNICALILFELSFKLICAAKKLENF